MLKQLYYLILFCIFTFSAKSQNNEIRFIYGIAESDLVGGETLDGAGDEQIKNVYELGLRYLLYVSENLALETGISYLNGEVDLHSFPTPDVTNWQENLQITSIPIFVNYTFLEYLFVNGGPVMDFQFSNNTTDSQSGIGFSLGLGAKYSFNNFWIFANPHWRRYAVIPFEQENYHQQLAGFGLQVGAGFRF